MENSKLYYLFMLVPLFVIFSAKQMALISSFELLILLSSYFLIYRTYIDGKRLADKNLIPETEIWKMLIPGQRFKYFQELYFDKRSNLRKV